MAKRVAIPPKHVKPRIVGPLGYFDAYRIQRLEFPANFPSTTVDELGNSKHAGTLTDIPECTVTVQAFDVSHKIFAYLTGVSPTSYGTGAWNSTTGKGEGGVDVKNLSYCDFIGYFKDVSTTDIVKAIHVRKMLCTDFTFTYNVGAESTEEYTFGGSEKRYFSQDVFVQSGVINANAFTLSYTPIVLKNSNKLISFIADGTWIEEGVGTGYYSVSGTTVSYTASNGTPVLAVYQANASMTWTDISDTTVPNAIRGKNIPIYIRADDSQWDKMYRVQSVTIRGTFPNTKIMEMGNTAVVGYIVDPPDVTGDVSILDTDLEVVALLTDGDIASADTEFRVSDYENRTLALRVEVQSPGTFGSYVAGSVTKTVVIPKMRITSEGTTANIGGQATQTFAFTSDDGACIVFSGTWTVGSAA